MCARIRRQASAASFRRVGSCESAARIKERASSTAMPRRARTWPVTRDIPSSREIDSATSTEKASQVHREGRESTRAILGSEGDGTGVPPDRPRNLRGTPWLGGFLAGGAIDKGQALVRGDQPVVVREASGSLDSVEQ